MYIVDASHDATMHAEMEGDHQTRPEGDVASTRGDVMEGTNERRGGGQDTDRSQIQADRR